MDQTIAEKVLSVHSGAECRAGDIVVASVDFCMSQDGTSTMMIRELESLGFSAPKTKRGMAVVIDHNSPCPSVEVAKIHFKIRDFARTRSIPIHDVGDGVCHQVVPEGGYVLPGDLAIGADSHTCTYGALNACSTGLGSADVAAAAFTGKLWFKVPESFSIKVAGGFADRIGAKDLALKVIGSLTADGATYRSVEFSGEAIDSLIMDGRFTIANMAVEMGAKFCPFGFDSKTAEWLSQRGLRADNAVSSDDGATYEKVFEFDASDLVPKVAKPHSVDKVVDASDLRGIAIQQAFLGTCTNGRISDLEAAARVLKGHQIRTGVRMIVAPASRSILLSAMDRGIISQLLKAGAAIVTPGCGPCVGTHAGIPSDGENVISTANRNFKGRMGNNKDVGIYLASPETVAASAIKGEITDPREI
ncbi:MAG: 3-isopropylmalate dehydratase large subunit [Thermoplasmatota archaeon]|nr:3-isopropylmalate dehydratase large subunit [Candidatus Thermoplasmatota archaeon]MBU1914268.1 3-isopropylmalate dehydratase large subunit [Candidatus Thermoplasmatota archaeon]